MKILVIEDEPGLREALVETLKSQDYLVDGTDDGETGMDMIRSGLYDLVILDVMLPGLNGLDVLSIIRKLNINTPVILLTALAQLSDKIAGIDCGADDYITKPFETQELLARIRMVMRRNNAQPSLSTSTVTISDLALDTANFSVSCLKNSKKIQLAKKEFHLLEYLMKNFGQVLSREQITVRVWGYESETEYNNVDVYISYLRKKLAFIQTKLRITAVRGVGYKLEERSADD